MYQGGRELLNTRIQYGGHCLGGVRSKESGVRSQKSGGRRQEVEGKRKDA